MLSRARGAKDMMRRPLIDVRGRDVSRRLAYLNRDGVKSVGPPRDIDHQRSGRDRRGTQVAQLDAGQSQA